MKVNLAMMGVAPFCPKCGGPAMFLRRANTPEELVETHCGSMTCDWRGLSRTMVPQPSAETMSQSDLRLAIWTPKKHRIEEPEAGA